MAKRHRILIAEDDDMSRQNLKDLLEESGYEAVAFTDGKEAMDAYVTDRYDLVLTDLRMPRIDGLELLSFIKEINPDALVILITGYGTVNTAVDAMKMGAFDYITKPIREDRLKISVNRALSFHKLKEENVVLRDHLKERFDLGKLIGYSETMKKVFEKIQKVSTTDSTILIHGESGTGKELAARAIHFNSERKEAPLVPVNCGAIPEDLLESELFGHEKGAFTGAIRTRMGRFELAQGGTIFLDEIGDMSQALQVKVLRVIQERQYERIGGVRTFNADVRIIAATNQDLEDAVREKRFREDLFYRINVIPIYLPPLRERGLDVAILANSFLKKFNKQNKKTVPRFSAEAIQALMDYPWPGNVRELENMVEMLVVMKDSGEITVEDLPEKIASRKSRVEQVYSVDFPDEGVNFNDMVIQFEKDLLLKALEKSGGVKNRAAKLLNLNRTTLVEKLKRL
ncbi:MAG TPA: sigma-54 dependent transcriptional regulator [Syntrophales bacterium]|nr:sigma-54 dependent transcriptional regulator [Syntrophales bacterium]